jgi:hypothetical protein
METREHICNESSLVPLYAQYFLVADGFVGTVYYISQGDTSGPALYVSAIVAIGGTALFIINLLMMLGKIANPYKGRDGGY